MEFLDNGGSLYIESVNIGSDYENTAFFDYLGINFIGEGGEDEIHTLKGNIPNNEALFKFNYLGGDSPHYGCDLLSANQAVKLMSSQEGAGRFFVNETDDYKLISSSAVLAAFANGDTLNLKNYLLSEFVNYFIDYNPATSLQENVDNILSGSSYPNPFSSNITIEFDIDVTDYITVGIYNINGQLIKELENNELIPGSYKYSWDATSKNGGKVKNGFYFCKISNGNQTVTEKLILLQ
jgi:hypothetical protein